MGKDTVKEKQSLYTPVHLTGVFSLTSVYYLNIYYITKLVLMSKSFVINKIKGMID